MEKEGKLTTNTFKRREWEEREGYVKEKEVGFLIILEKACDLIFLRTQNDSYNMVSIMKTLTHTYTRTGLGQH